MPRQKDDFPVDFECVECGTETSITYEDTSEVPDDWAPRDAVDVVLTSRGWREMPEGRYCPNCTDDPPNSLS